MSIKEKLLNSLNAYSARNAFYIQNKYYTYLDLKLKAGQIQHALKSFSSEQKVGIFISDDIETYASLVALLLLGKTYVPIHPHNPADRTAKIVEQANIKVILSALKPPYEISAEVINTSHLTGYLENIVSIQGVEVLQDTFAYILFTSGSTGVPKGVPISYFNLNSFIEAFDKLGYETDSSDKFLQMFDLTFDLSVMSYLVPLCKGASVFTVPDEGLKYMNIYKLLSIHDISFALMVPSVLINLTPYFSEIELPALRYSLFCGEALYKDVVTGWAKCSPNARIDNVYGPTEATIFCLTYNIDISKTIKNYHGIVSIGIGMSGMAAMVVDENNNELQKEEKGELCLAGDQLTIGYLNVESNKSVFFNSHGTRWYRTGDLAYRDADGDFMYCGRVDNQVKIQGFRIELSEIEFHLRTITGKPTVVAVVIEQENGMNRIDVVFEGEISDINNILKQLSEKVPPYMLPSQAHFVEKFPLNVNGKTDRKALVKMISNKI